MNADLFRGQWNAFKGELKKEWAKFTDDDLKKIDGEHDRLGSSPRSLPRSEGRGQPMGR